ncbi:MAG: sulfatase-like hydrolase/transferase [Flavobacteriales bacterium]|nr:sulfatase-like hydrolase/transferase [Flavobacteriales bacterium]
MRDFLKKIPPYISYSLLCFLVLFIICMVYKVVFYNFFYDSFASGSSTEIKHAVWISTRFDIRLSIILTLPVTLLSMIISERFFSQKTFKRISRTYFSIVALVLALALMMDAGCFSYTSVRLNASLLEFAKNPLISLKMMWQTYPVVWAAITLVVVMLAFYFLFSAIYRLCSYSEKGRWQSKTAWRALWVLLVAWGLYGSTSHYPLRWSEAYFSKDKNINSLSLNPVLYFFSSFTSADTSVDMDTLNTFLPSIEKHLGTAASSPFDRIVKGRTDGKRPNVVFVMLESFGAAPMSAFGNPMPSTPHTDSLLKKCLFFSNAYVPRWGTAYTVYCSTTGIPDVTMGTTASRIPQAIDQRIILDQADGYHRYYMLGGSANWANIRAVFQSNVSDVKIYEEGSYKNENRVDVWGIDDYDLFTYASEIFDSLNKASEPFVAYVQTSSNHRPYTVPDVKEDYRPLTENEVDIPMMRKAGFLELGQYNAVRYLDFNIARFVRLAEKQGWAENTVIVFFGDHNMSMDPYTHGSRPEYKADLTLYHIPIFVYAPWTIQGKEITSPATLMDVMPTGFAVAGIPYTNHTLGRDMTDSTHYRDSHAFICQPFGSNDGLTIVGDSTIYRRHIDSSVGAVMYRYKNGEPLSPLPTDSPEGKKLDSLALGFYHSARYLYFNNKKQ